VPSTERRLPGRAIELTERCEAVNSSITRYFAIEFATGSRVLDVGAGSGRDLAALVAGHPVGVRALGQPWRQRPAGRWAAYWLGRLHTLPASTVISDWPLWGVF
jgi:hypothetical protein